MNTAAAQILIPVAFVAFVLAVMGAAAAGVAVRPSGWLYRRRQRRLAHAAWVARVRLAQDVQRYARLTPADFSGDGLPLEDWLRFRWELRWLLRDIDVHRILQEMTERDRRHRQ